MNISPQIISLIITGLALLLIAVQVIVGAVRGLKKSVFRLIWIFGWGIICILTASVVAKLIVNMDISFLNINVNGTKITTLPAYIQQTLESSNPDIATMIAENPKILELCTSIASMIFSLVVFEILFWGTKLLLWPIWAILSHIFFGKKKAKKQVNKVDQKPEIERKLPAPKKHGGFGALVGLGLGVLTCLFTFIPLASINNAILKVEAETATEQGDGTTKGIVSELLQDKSQYMYVYEDSYLNLAFKYTGLGYVQKGMSAMITNTRYNGQSFNFDAEVSNLAPVYKDYLVVKDKDFTNLSKADIEEMLPAVDDAQKRVLSSGIVKSVYDEIMPYIVKNILTRDDYFIKLPQFENEFINQVLRDTLKAFFGINAENEIDYSKVIKIGDVSADLSKVLDVAGLVNDQDLLADVIGGNFDFDDLQLKLTEKTTEIKELSSSCIDKVFDMKTISTVVDVALEPAIKYGIELIPTFDDYEGNPVSVVYTAVDGGVKLDSFKQFLKLIAQNGVDIVKNIDQNSKIYISTENFGNVGAVVDFIKDNEDAKIISTGTYNSIINYGKKFAEKFVKNQELNQELKDVAVDMLNKIENIDSYETELIYIGQAYKIYDESENLDELVVCKMLDKIKLTQIYQLNINNIIDAANDIAVDYVNENNLPFATTNIITILNSVKNVASFETEWAKIEPIYGFMTELANSANFKDEIMKEENLQTLGNKFDTAIASGSILLSDANCKLFLNSFVEKITLPENFAKYKATIKNNINSIENYETELVAVSKALKLQDITSTGRQKYVDIGEVIDDVKNSVLFGNLIDDIITDYIDEALDAVSIDACLQTAVDAAISNISNGLTYKNELGYIYDLINANILDIASLKAYLQGGLLDADGDSKSKLITNDVLYDAIIGVAGEITISDIDVMSDVIVQLELDKENGENILDVVNQLEGLEAKINGLKEVPNFEDIDRSYLENLGSEIDRLSTEFDLLLNQNAVSKIGNYVAGVINQKVQERTELSHAIRDDIQNIYDERNSYDSFETMFGDFADALQI